MNGKKHAFLCVGGPYDGKRYSATDYGFKVAHTPWPMAISFKDDLVPASSVNYTAYIAQRLFSRTNGDEVWVWAPFEQKPDETLKKLLERYEQSANIQWS